MRLKATLDKYGFRNLKISVFTLAERKIRLIEIASLDDTTYVAMPHRAAGVENG